MDSSEKTKFTEHELRMAHIAHFAPPPTGTSAYETWKLRLGSLPKDPEVDREIRKKFKKAIAIIGAQLDNGAGFSIDKLLRDFLLEYNGRSFMHGFRSMPASFNAMEDYYEFVPEIGIFKLLPERDHLFSFLEFLDYMTSKNAPPDTKDVHLHLEDNVIYSYNITNDPGDITFSINKGVEYGVGGAAVVRHGNEVCVALLAGQKADLSEKTKYLQELKELVPLPGKESIKPAEEKVREAVPLLGNKQFWQTLVLTRIDLEYNTMGVRYALHDWGDSFQVDSDDTNLWRSEVPPYDILPDHEDDMKRALAEIHLYDTLFELCKTVLFLPLFFDQYSEDIVVENHSTRLLKRIKKGGEGKKKIKYINADERITRRSVSVLRLPNEDYPIRSLYSAPSMKFEVSGFWKILPFNQVGSDKHGLPIHGRTWVEKTLSWVQSTEEPGALLAERHILERTSHAEQSALSNRGYVYVMRSAAHVKDIFKIGITRRLPDIRSEELSRTTGSPDKFLVVQEWEVSDCQKAERLIHQTLEQYRINTSREFFKAPYQLIRQAIEEVFNQIEHDKT
jgi:hypothetical protein